MRLKMHFSFSFMSFCFFGILKYTETAWGSFSSGEAKTAIEFLKDYEQKATEMSKFTTRMSWQYQTDINEANLGNSVEASTNATKFFMEGSNNSSSLEDPNLPKDIIRQLMLISRSSSPKAEDKLRLLNQLQAKMTQIYSLGKVYYMDKEAGKPQYLELDPDLINTMAKSRDYEKLLFAWKGWRDAVGPKMKPLYERFVKLLNLGAHEHGWTDNGMFERSHYELGADFTPSLHKAWNAIRPLYEELHAYVRYKLSQHYKNVSVDKLIPAHLLGDMWAQNWDNIFNLVNPFPNVSSIDVTENLKAQNYTVQKMFELAQSFYISMGLDPMPFSFWNMSVLEKPKIRKVVCHASAWDFSEGEVRVKMCTKINHGDLIVVHHEMGHCEYFLAYKDKPFAYRGGANPGFHEAIGDTIALSVENPTHLKEIGLLYDAGDSEESSIAFLLRMALRRVVMVPFAFLVDQWRWKAFSGNITGDTYNTEWWNLRNSYQGIASPVPRAKKDFDPGAKFHIGANSPYISYFFSYILQFQFHRALCKIAKSNKPLHECSIYKSKAAGAKFREMLASGSSKPWRQILHRLTGEWELRVDAMLEYFQPLMDWMKSYRKKKKYPLGWKSTVTSDQSASVKDSDKPIILTNATKLGLSYIRAVATESNAISKTNKKSRKKIEELKNLDSVNWKVTSKDSSQQRSILVPLGQTKSSILNRPVFVPSIGKEPLTLVKKNDGNKYNTRLQSFVQKQTP